MAGLRNWQLIADRAASVCAVVQVIVKIRWVRENAVDHVRREAGNRADEHVSSQEAVWISKVQPDRPVHSEGAFVNVMASKVRQIDICHRKADRHGSGKAAGATVQRERPLACRSG